MTANWKVLGVNNDQTTCDLCGKSNLRKVVVLENVETGEMFAVVGNQIVMRKGHDSIVVGTI